MEKIEANKYVCEIQTRSVSVVTCPNCNHGEFTVGHMTYNDNWDWSCSECKYFFNFCWDKGNIVLTQIPSKYTHALALVKFVGSHINNELFFIVKTTHRYGPDGQYNLKECMESDRYYIEEHTCPTNLIQCEAIIHNGDCDPHGVLQFVRSAPIIDICAELNITEDELLDSNNDYMFRYFHECNVKT